MKDLILEFKEIVEKNNLFKKNDKLLLGVSGGPDSIFLLHAVKKLEKELNLYIEVAHINHMLREEATRDEEFVMNICQSLGIKFNLLKIDVKKETIRNKKTLEECARDIRYEYFNKILNENKLNKIVVAHNLSDNVETVFMNIIRGTGGAGLSGMDFESNNIIRPMLNMKKEDIVKYLDENNLEYVIDKTNLENDYTRNRIRNDLIKKIEKEYNPNILITIQRMIELNRQDSSIIESAINETYSKINKVKKEESIQIDLKDFKEIDESLKSRIIRKILEELLGNVKSIEKIHIEDILKLIKNSIKGKRYIIGNKFEVLIASKNEVIFKRIVVK